MSNFCSILSSPVLFFICLLSALGGQGTKEDKLLGSEGLGQDEAGGDGGGPDPGNGEAGGKV